MIPTTQQQQITKCIFQHAMAAKPWCSQCICKLVECVLKESSYSTKECKGWELDESCKADKDFREGNVRDEVELSFTNSSKKNTKLFQQVWVILNL
jgi:hypothetical protein